MDKSDIKKLIKEIFLTEALFGRKLVISYDGSLYNAIISKNTIPYENEYRLSYYDKRKVGSEDDTYINDWGAPAGHEDLTKKEVQQMIETGRFPRRLEVFNMFIVKWGKEVGKLNENIIKGLGQKLIIHIRGDDYPAVISKNTKPDEYPYKLAWFYPKNRAGEVEAAGHADLQDWEVEFIHNYKILPPRVQQFLRKTYGEFKAELIRENIITEGMDVSVKGFNYERVDNLEGICSQLNNKILFPIIDKLPPDQMNRLKSAGMSSFFDFISPDGKYYSGTYPKENHINFYISPFTMNTAQTIIKGIFNELRKMGIKWGKVVKNQSGMWKSEVIRIPIISNKNVYKGPQEIHLSNRNAYHIFHTILQYEGEHSFRMNAEELKERIQALANDKGWVDKNVIKSKEIEPVKPGDEWKQTDEPSDEENPHEKVSQQFSNALGGKHYDFGLESDDIWNRLTRIYNIADWAVKNGYKEISVA